MTVGSKESTVQRSGTNQSTAVANSFDRRISLLIASGLVSGITPSSIRRQCGAKIPAFVSSLLDGFGLANEQSLS